MYKVLIVDDEVLVRVGLKSTIDWASLGFFVVAEASNGEQAYEAYRLHKPEVIITDIRMPKQDGLWLTKKIRQEDSLAKILILTCHNEFSYAREALKCGADDYILKSEVEDEELIKLMSDIKENLDFLLSEQQKYDSLRKQLDTNLEMLRGKLFEDFFVADLEIDAELQARCSELGFSLAESEFAMMLILRDDAERQRDFSEQEWRHMNSAILNMASDMIGESKAAFLVKENGNGFMFLLSKKSIAAAEIREVADSICSSMTQYFDIPLSAAISRIFGDIRELSGVYKELCLKAEQFFYTDARCVICASGQMLHNVNIFDIKQSYEQLLISYLDEEDGQQALDLIGQTETFFLANPVKAIEVRLFYSNIINSIFERYHHCFRNGDETEDYADYHNRIMTAAKMKSIVGLVREIIVTTIGNIRQYRLTNSNYIIKKAVDYIQNNYDKEISTKFLAEYLNLSKHYVCFLFKKETGCNISLYVNKLRIEKAKRMVLETNCKIKEIYDKLGFSDQQYFCKTFKRLTGMTVIQYRESILKRNRNSEYN